MKTNDYTRWTEWSGNFASQKRDAKSNKEESEFSLDIFVRAVQDSMPAGMLRIMNALQDAIVVKNKKK